MSQKMVKRSIRKKLLFVSLLLFPAGLLADECFCLIDQDDGLWFDCQTEESGQAEETEKTEKTAYLCADPGAGGERKSLSGADVWKQVASGTPPCTPCRLAEKRGAPPTPRQKTEE